MRSQAGKTGGALWALVAAVLFGCCGWSRSGAQEPEGPATANGHAARLSYLAGEVTAARADNTGTDPAQLNMPLAEGTRLATGDNGEAEIELEDGSVLRLTPHTSVALTLLDAAAGEAGHRQTMATLLYGLLYAELRVTATTVVRLSAGDDTVVPLSNAAVRVSFDQLPPAIADLVGWVRVEHAGTAQDGNGAGSGYQVRLEAGEQLEGDARDPRTYAIAQSIPHDSWDDWNEQRAQEAQNSASDRTAARDAYAGTAGYGWSDLDSSGTWYSGAGTSGAGQNLVWQPNEATSPGFDPYGTGSWVYLTGPGYVWASGYAWGWTPYRCGSWSYRGGFGWGWSPSGGCGTGRWFVPGRGGWNVTHSPPNWRHPLPPPSPGPLRAHPIVVASSTAVPLSATPPPDAAFTAQPPLASATAQPPHALGRGTLVPLQPLAEPLVTRGSSALGSTLRRDFPVDRKTQAPEFGFVRPPLTGLRAPGLVAPGLVAPGLRATGSAAAPGAPTAGLPAAGVRAGGVGVRSTPGAVGGPPGALGRPAAGFSRPGAVPPSELRAPSSAQPPRVIPLQPARVIPLQPPQQRTPFRPVTPIAARPPSAPSSAAPARAVPTPTTPGTGSPRPR